MTEKRPYHYTVLRYVHDIRTGEFINVGVLLRATGSGDTRFRTRHTFGRIKAIFPDLDGDAFRTTMSAVDRALSRAVLHEEGKSSVNVMFIARSAIPDDDSALRWSEMGSGVSEDMETTLTRLFTRFVSRYDGKQSHRRSDDEVWRPVRQRLIDKAVPIYLEEKVIVGATDQVALKHAWKNGQWHAYEPVSLDLADAEGIKDKARRWRGHLAAVADGSSRERLKLHFIVGRPQNATLLPAYQNALAILRHADFNPEIFEESQIDELVTRIEDEVRSHQRQRHQ